MKKILAAAVIVAGIAWSPAVAQEWDYEETTTRVEVADRGFCDNDRATELTWQIRREQREHDIDWNTARELRAEVDRTAALESHYCATGMTAWRAENLDRRYAQIEEELRAESLG